MPTVVTRSVGLLARIQHGPNGSDLRTFKMREVQMTNGPSDTPRSFRSKPLRSSIEVVAKAARVALGLRHEEQAFELPGRLFEQLPFAVYVCDRDGRSSIQRPRCRTMGPVA